jgi:glycosyltransferase involved in cell wall biosynthesis
MEKPASVMTVSYCIPLYNKERYIAAVLEAALQECAMTGGEVLVYDDASTDGSLAIVEALAARHPITLIKGGINRGVFEATNILIARSREPYLRLIDADDQALPGSTAHLLDLLQRHDAVLARGVCGSAAPPAQDYAGADVRVEDRPFSALLRNVDFNLSVSVMPAAALRAVLPLPEGLQISQDVCVALRLAKGGRFVRSAAIVTAQPVEAANRLSRRVAAMYRDICLIIAGEFGHGVTRRDAAYAARRQAARCTRYFRREAPDCLGSGDKAFLARCRLALPVEPVAIQAARLRRIAEFYQRDAARVLV